MSNTWRPIAVRANDRVSFWRPIPDAKITVSEARALAGLDGNEQSPGCYVAQKVDGRQTFLMFKGPQV